MQQSFKNKKSTLYIVSTPIGNLSDMTYRAVETLKNVDCVLAEDTRTSQVLLKHYNIETRTLSYHEHNHSERIDQIISMLDEGLNVALISDAGTPLVSDPGNFLVQTVADKGYNVVGIPGASAALTALVSSGLQAQPFIFLGFLPKKEMAIKDFLSEYKEVSATIIIYESPNRINKTLKYLYEVLGDRHISVARELTKIHEEIIRGSLVELIDFDFDSRGEYTIVCEGYKKQIDENISIEDYYKQVLKTGLDEKEAMKKVAKDLGISKRDVYQKIKVNIT